MARGPYIWIPLLELMDTSGLANGEEVEREYMVKLWYNHSTAAYSETTLTQT